MLISVPIQLGVSAIVVWYLVTKHRNKMKTGNYPFVAGDMQWTIPSTLKFIGISLITGILAATFGLGGGTLNSPVMLELGVLPAVIPATSGLMILITSSIAIIQYFALGSAVWDYMLWYGGVGFIGGVVGHIGIRYYIKKFRKQSMIIFLLAFLILAGFVCLLYNFTVSFINGTAIMSMSSPCAQS